jgi:isocitrate lyase
LVPTQEAIQKLVAAFASVLAIKTVGTPSTSAVRRAARQFAAAIHSTYPGKLLAYNCSPSFYWKATSFDEDGEIAGGLEVAWTTGRCHD